MGSIIITDRTGTGITIPGVERAAYDKVRQAILEDEDLAFENPDTGRAIAYAPGAILKVEWDPADAAPEEAPQE